MNMIGGKVTKVTMGGKALEEMSDNIARKYNIQPSVRGNTKKESWLARKIATIRFTWRNRKFL